MLVYPLFEERSWHAGLEQSMPFAAFAGDCDGIEASIGFDLNDSPCATTPWAKTNRRGIVVIREGFAREVKSPVVDEDRDLHSLGYLPTRTESSRFSLRVPAFK